MWRPYLLLATIFVCIVLPGCASLQDKTAAHTGCRSSEITILEDHIGVSSRTWVAQCRGRRYQCADIGTNTSQIDCTAEDGATHDAARATSAAPSASAVERIIASDGGQEFVVLRTHVDIAPYRLSFAAAPVYRAGIVVLTISAPLAQLAGGCRAGVMIDGRITPLTGSSREEAGRRQYQYELDLSRVRELAAARRASGRICDQEWRLEETEKVALRELLARIDEELAWVGQQTSGAESPAP